MRSTGFFEGVRQADIDLDGDLCKMPIFYYDGEAMSGVFAARLSVLRKMLPDRRLTPARLAPGVGAISITCFEYRESDVGTYNELAVGIVLSHPARRLNIPGRAMLGGLLRGQLDAYVHQLPVTTDLALRAGRELWNFPKFVTPIDYEEDATTRTCHLTQDGQQILTMRVPKMAGGSAQQIQLLTHTYQDGQPQGGEFKLAAQRFGWTLRPGTAQLELGDSHPIATELASALLSTRSIAAAYTPAVEGILFGPTNISSRMIQLAAHAHGKSHGGGSSNGKAKSAPAKSSPAKSAAKAKAKAAV